MHTCDDTNIHLHIKYGLIHEQIISLVLYKFQRIARSLGCRVEFSRLCF